MLFAKVIVNLSLDKTFDYIIPQSLEGMVEIGAHVAVRFNNSVRKGYVLDISDKSDYPVEKISPLESLGEKHAWIPPRLVKLGQWMAEYYCCSREAAIRTLLPGAVRSGKIKPKKVSWIELADRDAAEKFILTEKKAKAKVRVVRVLLDSGPAPLDILMEKAEAGRPVISALLQTGLLKEEKITTDRRAASYDESEIIRTRPHELNDEQSAALAKITSMTDSAPPAKKTLLLYGVTGSGKTEVYLQAISRALEKGLESIVLVPEISLTPQTVHRFRARFGDMVSVLHSGLTEVERFEEWLKTTQGKVKIAVGARSALFAPFRNLGLIVVDEEHETSYKQNDTSPRYHARDVAVMRGVMENAVVVLGSATPSFESYHNARSGKYELSRLDKRVDDKIMPEIKIVDLRLDSPEEGKARFFSKMLVQAVRDRLAAGEQTILFLNRRGYARQMLCEQCGYVAECPMCSIPLTYHKKDERLSCHLCGLDIKSHQSCPQCGAPDIRYSGVGTEKVEALASEIFPHARIARMDSDTMRKSSSYEKVFDEFKRGCVDILIGTQMIAKGLHFPNVTLVGIINADMGLYIPDFRAEERTFQLITQVAGRAGRGDVSGEVLIQTFTPMNPAIQFASKHDFDGFFEEEMEIRKDLGYPPFGHLTAVFVKGKDQAETENYSKLLRERASPALHEGIMVSEPAPAPIEKINNYHRYVMMFRGGPMGRLKALLRAETLGGRRPHGVDAHIDVDAISTL